MESDPEITDQSSENHTSDGGTINGDPGRNSTQNTTAADGFLSPSGQYVNI